eukprot:Nitzschia sp. Nitz4//scaffold3_size479765//33069//33755//NITZ4_000013-RA/size479765-processed-gene-0.42-mRNA-1//1//CDS//3329550497//4850//frame0
MNNTSSNPTAGSLVRSNTVSSQFNALTRDVEKFRNARHIAEADFQQTQAKLQLLKKEQAELLTKFRVEQEVFGKLNQKRSVLSNEKARLDRTMNNEHKALQVCAGHSKVLCTKANEATIQYTLDMGEASNEVSDLLRRHINQKILRLLSPKSVQAVLVPKFPRGNPERLREFQEGFRLLHETSSALEECLTQNEKLRSRLGMEPHEPLGKSRPCSLQPGKFCYERDSV